jgi:hypothetical protein
MLMLLLEVTLVAHPLVGAPGPLRDALDPGDARQLAARAADDCGGGAQQLVRDPHTHASAGAGHDRDLAGQHLRDVRDDLWSTHGAKT